MKSDQLERFSRSGYPVRRPQLGTPAQLSVDENMEAQTSE